MSELETDIIFHRQRKTVSIPEDTVKLLMQKFYPTVEADVQTRFINDPKTTRKKLAALDEIFTEARGKQLIPAALCAEYLSRAFVRPTRETAMEAWEENSIAEFIFYHDLEWGMGYPIWGVLAETREKDPNIDTSALAISHYDEMTQTEDPLSEQIEAYLSMKLEREKTKALFEDDPRGFSLVDYYVQRVKAEAALAQIPEMTEGAIPVVPDFIVAGAELARRVYKDVYPICASLRRR